jgi:RND family efflux transporter MFP subunit
MDGRRDPDKAGFRYEKGKYIMSMKQKLLKAGLPVIVILFGASVMAALISNRPGPKKEVRKEQGALVSVIEVVRVDRRVVVAGTGTVQCAREITVVPQVNGRVTFISPSFVTGGFFQKGDLMFEIEDADYRLALERARAAKAKAEYDLSVVESQARVARSEWERMNKDGGSEPNPLVVYEPQLKNSRAALASAEAAIRQAELDLERTKIRAPFNCRVRSENVDPGQYVRSGGSVAVLAGTDTAEVVVPLPPDDLHWLDIPRPGDVVKEGSPAKVLVDGGTFQWEGNIIRSFGELDPKSRMMQVVIGVKDPYGLSRKADNNMRELPVGTFVDVKLSGKTLRDIIAIPRQAFRENATVWVIDESNALRIRKVNPVRIERETVMIGSGLKAGDKIVLTSISGAADGLKLRTSEGESGS